MIDGVKPYPEMKDTGLPWADQVPSHWQLVPNRALLRKRKLLVGDRHTEYRLLSLTKAGVIVRDISTGRGKFSADMGTSQEVREGDLVFCLFDVPETPRTVGLSKHHGMITGAYTVFECKDNQLARFLEAFYIAMDDRKLLSPLYSGLRNTIPPPVLLGQKTPLPPAPEQAAIVRFLDHADRKIRHYIRAKQKLIKLLEEQKQFIIYDAVSRGLDPNVRLKPSEVEWLGEIPEHWGVRRAKGVCSAIVDCKNRTPDAIEGGSFLVVRTTCVRGGKFNASGGFTTNAENFRVWTSRGAPQFGDVFFTREAPAGEACLVPDQADLCMGQRMMYFRPDPDLLDPEFLLLNIYGPLTRAYIELETNGSTVGHLRLGQVYSLPLVWCPVEEQRAIVAHAHAASQGLEQAQASAKKEITLLHEYRIRLIADVVTGKLDVREAAAGLPEAVMEEEFGADELDEDLEVAEGGIDLDNIGDA